MVAKDGLPPRPVEQSRDNNPGPSSLTEKSRKDPRKTAAPGTDNNEIFSESSQQSFMVVQGQIPEALRADLERDFLDEELEKILVRANKRSAPSVDKPAALWIFGPSAVGKSFITGAKAVTLFNAVTNAVLIDGTDFREVHAGFNAVAVHGQENGLLHADAWPIFKTKALEAKDGKPTLKRRMVNESIRDRQNLIMPDCANNPNRLKALIEEVKAAGYAMHAVCLWAPLSVTRARGEERSVREGKLWTGKDYGTSTKALLTLAMRWLDGMRDEPESFVSLELWDNSGFPAKEVGLQEFAQLVSLDDDDATKHAESLTRKRHSEHMKTMSGSAKAIAKVRPEVDRINTAHKRRTWSINFSGTPTAAPMVAPQAGTFVGSAEQAENGRSIQLDFSAHATAPAAGSGFKPASSFTWGERWRGRAEGLLMGLLIGGAVAIVAWVTD